MTMSKHQALGGKITPEEFKRLCEFVAEHEDNIPRYEQAKRQLDEAWEEHWRLQRAVKTGR